MVSPPTLLERERDLAELAALLVAARACEGHVALVYGAAGIGTQVTDISQRAFADCSALTSVYFKGNPPALGEKVFDGDDKATVYYLKGITGWGTTFGGRPTAVWNPPAQGDAVR